MLLGSPTKSLGTTCRWALRRPCRQAPLRPIVQRIDTTSHRPTPEAQHSPAKPLGGSKKEKLFLGRVFGVRKLGQDVVSFSLYTWGLSRSLHRDPFGKKMCRLPSRYRRFLETALYVQSFALEMVFVLLLHYLYIVLFLFWWSVRALVNKVLSTRIPRTFHLSRSSCFVLYCLTKSSRTFFSPS